MKKLVSINLFLGTSMFMFGILKFINPFKSWYTTQIVNSGMGNLSYSLGITGEIVTGGLLLYSVLFSNRIRKDINVLIVVCSSIVIVLMMATGIYVHLHPDVPADVLPLKIKPPYIPFIFLILGLFNIRIARKNLYTKADQ
jgi:hypothetical protein